MTAGFERMHRHAAVPLLLTGIFLGSRLVFYLAGVRFDMTPLTGQIKMFQLLDLHQLQHNLVQSIWYLQSQPPLFNLVSGLLLKLPTVAIRPTLVVASLVLGLGLVLTSYYLALELHVPRRVSFVLAVVVVLDPANVLYGNWYFYSFPTAVALTFAALCLARHVRTGSLPSGLGFFGSLMSVVLLNSTFQWFWLVIAAAPLVIVLRRRRRSWQAMLAMAAVPLLLVSLWYVKNAVLFHTYSTSSWAGMNLSKVARGLAPPDQLAKLIAEKRVSPVSRIGPFEPVSAYGPNFDSHPVTGVVVLDQRTKDDGTPNFNNINYIRISNQLLHDDLVYIRAYPGTYAHNVSRAAILFFVPPEQYNFVEPNSRHLSGFLSTFDRYVAWEPRPTAIATNSFAAAQVTFGQVSIGSVITFSIVLLAIPFMVWRRRSDAPWALTLTFIWMSTAYVLALTTLVEYGENERFRYDLGPLPLIAAVAVVVALLKRRPEEPNHPVT
jgi:hypothetical protein